MKNGTVRLIGLTPGTTYTKQYTVETSDSNSKSVDVTFTTRDITVNLEGTVGATSVSLKGSVEPNDATIIERGFVDGVSGDSMTVGGLDPATTHTYTYYIKTLQGGKTFSQTATFTTKPLELTMKEAKVVSTGNVLVSAESNIANEIEDGLGFEWRRSDWGDDVASVSGEAFVHDGKVEGNILNLASDWQWKARTFYKSVGGTYYYSNWIDFTPINASYAAPSVHTYAYNLVEGNMVHVLAYALRGSEVIVEQGYKYKKKVGKSGSPLFPQAEDDYDDAMTVFVTGSSMAATLENLQENTQYTYVAFVKTSSGEIFYGEEQTVEIDDPTGIGGIAEETPANDDNISVKVYTLSGKLVYSGAEADMSLDKGLYIIRYSDGKTKKVAY